jgi:M6 family metalloprotease-like protein
MTRTTETARSIVSLLLGLVCFLMPMRHSFLVASATAMDYMDDDNDDDNDGYDRKNAAAALESVRDYRRRLDVPFDYEPNFLDENVCRFVKDDECESMDHALERSALHTREVATTTHKLQTLVVLIQWQDHISRELIPAEQIDLLWNADGTDPTLYPSGSVRDYINQNSYGNLEVEFHVQDWQMTNGTELFYADGRFGYDQSDTQSELRQALYYVLDQMEAAGFPWEQYDTDGDLEIDSIIFMHSGYDAADGGVDCQNPQTGTMENRIWSHATSSNWREDPWTSERTGIQLDGYAIVSVFRGYCDAKIVRLGILAHEFFHTLGLPDLYDADDRYNGNNGVGGLGSYDVMSNPAGPGHRPKWPGMLSPWSKLEMEWIRPIEITESGTYLARPSQNFADIYIIRRGYDDDNDNEYLLIENRQPIGYDSRMRGQGILIYHIDATNQNNSIRANRNRGFPGQAGWPGNGKHYPVALLQADGKYELEKTSRDHNAADFFHNEHRLGPGNGELEASSEGVYPNTDSYANGVIRPTGLVIDHFQETGEAGEWSFRVTFPEETEAPTGAPTDEACRQIFELQLRTDFFPRETSWELTDVGGHVVAQNGDWINDGAQQDRLEPMTTYDEWICLQDKDEEYHFTVYDYYGDGMCDAARCRGWWKLWLNGVMVVEGNGDFEFSTMSTFMTSTSTTAAGR